MSRRPSEARREGSAIAQQKKRKRRRRRGRGRGGGGRDDLGQVARRWLGVTRLHAEQEQAIRAVIEGRDTLVVLPTGFGKSLIYQVPALLLDRPTVVVSPLIALMQDQEQKLQRRRIPVARLDSTLKRAQRREVLNRVAKGKRLILLTTPETLEGKDADVIRGARPALLCVDEAHCISEWGHDFRPAYLRLGAEREALGSPPVLALTATATPRVREDIGLRLALKDPTVVTAPPHRRNLVLKVRNVEGSAKVETVARLIKRLQRPGIVYCSTTRSVDAIHSALARTRIPAARYHGGMKAAERDAAQRRFMKSGRRIVMIATTAFGMGIDKPDIRYIVHYQAPGSLEQYVQEAGRAGRDGKRADCILLFDSADLDIQRHLLNTGRPGKAALERAARALAAWVDEDRAVGVKELAASAGTTMTTARVLADALVEAGLAERDSLKKYKARGDVKAFLAQAHDLAGKYAILRDEDEERLQAVADYAQTLECRSVFIRRWFGEADPPPCGRCDICRAVERLGPEDD